MASLLMRTLMPSHTTTQKFQTQLLYKSWQTRPATLLCPRAACHCKGSDQSVTTHTDKSSVANSASPFTLIYRYRYIVHLKVFSRLKIYQTALTTVAVPAAVKLYMDNAMTIEMLQATLGLAGLACIMLYVISFSIMKVIGLVNLSNDGKQVRLSHLSFWGKRRDIVCDVSDVVPMADMSESSSHYFLRLRRYSSKQVLWLFVHHGEMADKNKLQYVIGSLK